MSESAKNLVPSSPLVVDLDGTLIKTDLLIEAALQMVSERPQSIPKIPFWLLRGKAALKAEIFSRVNIDVRTLPYNEKFLAYLREEFAAGREIVLATASPRGIAEKVAEHLGIFREVLATDATTNLAGSRKATALVARYGEKNFVYAANASVDLAVWKVAEAAQVVAAPTGLKRRVEAVCKVEREFANGATKSRPALLLKAMRVHQWAKNALIFAPILFAQRIFELNLLVSCVLAFAAFSLTASSVYLINDLLDLESDRSHVEKRRRPFASGDLPLHIGAFLTPLLLGAGMSLGLALSPRFFAVLAGYFVLTLAYSLRLKKVVLADVLILACLYAWRVFAGAVATSLPLSSWFLAFFMFLFLSLALVKRSSELILNIKHNQTENKRRGYWVSDLNQLVAFGSASGYLSVLVLALYVNADVVKSGHAYARPELLWLVCPLLLYWISRMWLKASRGEMHSDPLVYSMRDQASYVIIGVMAGIWLFASGIL